MNPVVHPLALPTIFQQSAGAKLRKMTRNFWLRSVQRFCELTHAKLKLPRDEQDDSNASVIGETLEQFWWTQPGNVMHAWNPWGSLKSIPYLDFDIFVKPHMLRD
ncbi:hypothetical protein GCM10022278_32620 [Allohahella marinimesophila]|uniref:Uncharacterized protein n=1 Tax=Allohahella marinimesophila TaxID=1054972 RepID=A0ABP7PXR4_9GAMM